MLSVPLSVHTNIVARRQAGAGVDALEGGDGGEALLVSDLRRVRESMLPKLRRGGCRVSAGLSGYLHM